jgi:hypothetical protein
MHPCIRIHASELTSSTNQPTQKKTPSFLKNAAKTSNNMLHLKINTRHYSSSTFYHVFLFIGCCFATAAILNNNDVYGFIPSYWSPSQQHYKRENTYCRHRQQHQMVGDAQGDYYGESSGSYLVKEFNKIEELENIVKLASQSIPERPDGIVVVAKFSSVTREECRATEAEYERFARANPASLFLRCMEEYENSDLLFGQVDILTWPTIDIFYQGNRVSRMEGPDLQELETVLNMYQFQNTELDLFSEDANQKRKLQWGDGKAKDMTRTPRTTNRFVPAYDWNTNKGFFDEQGDKAQQSFEDSFENWLPNIEDDDENDNNDNNNPKNNK